MGKGGGGEMFTYILDESCKALSISVLHNRSTSPLVSVYVFVQQSNANIYPIHPVCDSRKNTLQSLVTMDLHSFFWSSKFF